jgi:hypothetical protein
MPSRRTLPLPLLAAALSLVGTVAQAQFFSGQWVGDLCLVEKWRSVHGGDQDGTRFSVLIDEKDRIREEIPSMELAEGFPAREGYRFIFVDSPFWHKGAMYQTAHGEKADKDEARRVYRWTFAKREDDKWRVLGHYETGPMKLEAIPCDDGRFILISEESLVSGGGAGWQPFYVASFPEGSDRLRLDSAIDHGQDALPALMSEGLRFSLDWQSQTVVTDGHAALINPKTGLYWVFSLEKARLVRAGNIFKKVTPEMIAKAGFTDAVLHVAPEKQGTVLVMAQDEDYFTKNGDYWEESIDVWRSMTKGLVIDDMSQDEVREILKKIDMEVEEIMRPRIKQLAENSPHIVWYRIHPENGRAERLVDPPEGGATLRWFDGRETWGNYGFRPMPDGSVKMDWKMDLVSDRSKDADGSEPDAEGEGAAKEKMPPEGDGAEAKDGADLPLPVSMSESAA